MSENADNGKPGVVVSTRRGFLGNVFDCAGTALIVSFFVREGYSYCKPLVDASQNRVEKLNNLLEVFKVSDDKGLDKELREYYLSCYGDSKGYHSHPVGQNLCLSPSANDKIYDYDSDDLKKSLITKYSRKLAEKVTPEAKALMSGEPNVLEAILGEIEAIAASGDTEVTKLSHRIVKPVEGGLSGFVDAHVKATKRVTLEAKTGEKAR